MRAAKAQDAIMNAPLATQTQSKTIGTANAAHRQFTRMENKIQQAMAVMDKEICKLLNYCQLMRHPKYENVWSTSVANKFGRLVQGVGGQIKGTNTIFFIH